MKYIELKENIFDVEDNLKSNLLEALELVLRSYRELAERELSPNAVRQPILLAEA